MYGIIRNSTQDLIRTVDQLKIWRIILGYDVEIDELITSPFRSDAVPACYVRQYNGILLFTDWAFTQYNKYTILHAIAHLSQVSYSEAWNMVHDYHFYNKAMRIGNVVCTGTKRKVSRTNGKDMFFEPFLLDGKPAFTTADVEYWAKRNVTYTDLFSYSQPCYSVKSMHINGYQTLPKTYPCYALTFGADNPRFKIYCPLNSKQERFPMSTATKNDYWKWQNNTSTCIVTKSFKDGYLANKLTGLDTYAFQSESMMPDNLDFLSKYNKRVIVYDNDEAGMHGSDRIKQRLDIYGTTKQVYYPPFLGKDTDDMVVNGYSAVVKPLILTA